MARGQVGATLSLSTPTAVDLTRLYPFIGGTYQKKWQDLE